MVSETMFPASFFGWRVVAGTFVLGHQLIKREPDHAIRIGSVLVPELTDRNDANHLATMEAFGVGSVVPRAVECNVREHGESFLPILGAACGS